MFCRHRRASPESHHGFLSPARRHVRRAPPRPITVGPASGRFGCDAADRHRGSSRPCRPVLIIDEAQEALTPVLCELLHPSPAKSSIANSSSVSSSPRRCATPRRDFARRSCNPSAPGFAGGSISITPRATSFWPASRSSPHCRGQSLAHDHATLRVTLADHAAGNWPRAHESRRRAARRRRRPRTSQGSTKSSLL